MSTAESQIMARECDVRAGRSFDSVTSLSFEESLNVPQV
jgi:hypothetical protein